MPVINLVDIILALAIVASIVSAWRRGFLLAGAELLALIASVGCAFVAYPHALRLAERHELDWGVWTAPLAFLLVFVLTRILLGVLFARLIRTAPPPVHAHAANRTLGIVPGAANGLINATILAMLLLSLPMNDTITRAVAESLLANRLAAPAEWLEARLRPIFDPALDRTLSRLTVRPDSRESIALPFTVKNPKHRPELEAQMLAMVNEERRARGLVVLQADAEAANVARAHSADMFTRGYFSHITPHGADPFERMREGGLRFRMAGENLALARTLPMAHQGLMDSPGHRANILQPRFGRLGIGIVDGGRYGLMVTQNFRN